MAEIYNSMPNHSGRDGHMKEYVSSAIQSGHDMFQDANPFISNVHKESYEAKKMAKIRASYTIPPRTARQAAEQVEAEARPLMLTDVYGSVPSSSAGSISDKSGALVVHSARPQNAASNAAFVPTSVKSSTELALTRKGVNTRVPVPQWHAPWELSAVISGHLGWVRSIAFDPSNEWFVTGSADRTIKVWDLAKCCAGAEGGLKLTLTGHIGPVRGLVVSPRHPYLFSVGEDKMVKCWDLEYNKIIRHYHGHLSAVFTAAIHPTLDLLITGGRDSVARVWDIRTKHQIHVLGGHSGAVSSIITNGVDPQVITGSHDTTVKLWDIAAGKSMATLTQHKKAIRGMCMSKREMSFTTAAADNIKKWQVRDGKFLRNMSGHNAVINCVASNDDGVLVSAGDNGSINFWDYESGYCFQQSQTIVQPGSLDAEAGIFAAQFDLSGSRLITCEADKSIKIWKENSDATEDSDPIDMKAWSKQCLALKRY